VRSEATHASSFSAFKEIEMSQATNPVVWFEIYVQDMARARAFYEAVLGRPMSPLTVPASMTDSGLELVAFDGDPQQPNACGALAKIPGMPSGGSTLVYFGCEDCAVEAARVVPAGGSLHAEKFSIGDYGHIALAVDTEGNMFGLHSMR
jgi:predicted enzyme related to lactoylglutathione lyase